MTDTVQETRVQTLPIRSKERIARLCTGTVALGQYADKKGLPDGLRESFNRLPSSGPKIANKMILPSILERARQAPREIVYQNK